MRNTFIALFIFLSLIAIIIGLLYYFEVLALIALVIGFGALIAIILFTVVIGVVLIFAVPYYLVTKKPKVEEYGSYRLKDVKGKEEDIKENK